MKGRRIAFATATLTALHLLVFLRLAASADAILTVDGQKLHIETLGEARPAVVFEAGLGNDSNTWSLVAGPVAKFARVVLYDRAGLGRSLPMMNKKFRDNGSKLRQDSMIC
jgi:pimeloyl-ACP methyl ester carboxylesterase